MTNGGSELSLGRLGFIKLVGLAGGSRVDPPLGQIADDKRSVTLLGPAMTTRARDDDVDNLPGAQGAMAVIEGGGAIA